MGKRKRKGCRGIKRMGSSKLRIWVGILSVRGGLGGRGLGGRCVSLGLPLVLGLGFARLGLRSRWGLLDFGKEMVRDSLLQRARDLQFQMARERGGCCM